MYYYILNESDQIPSRRTATSTSVHTHYISPPFNFYHPFWVSFSPDLGVENLHIVHKRRTAEQGSSTYGTSPHWHGRSTCSA